jgi:hypothetical protein
VDGTLFRRGILPALTRRLVDEEAFPERVQNDLSEDYYAWIILSRTPSPTRSKSTSGSPVAMQGIPWHWITAPIWAKLVLNLTFVALLFAAPAIYNVIRWRKPDVVKLPEDDKKTQPEVPVLGKEPELKGYALTMLVASAGILGALLGQLFLVILLIHEIVNIDVTATVRWVLWILTVAIMAYASLYVGRGVVSTLREEVRWGTELTERKEELEKRKAELKAKPRRTKEEEKELKTIPERSRR